MLCCYLVLFMFLSFHAFMSFHKTCWVSGVGWASEHTCSGSVEVSGSLEAGGRATMAGRASSTQWPLQKWACVSIAARDKQGRVCQILMETSSCIMGLPFFCRDEADTGQKARLKGVWGMEPELGSSVKPQTRPIPFQYQPILHHSSHFRLAVIAGVVSVIYYHVQFL